MTVAVGTPLTLERALPIIDAAGQLGIPVLIRGGSGIGKTSAMTRLAEVRGEHLEVVTANLMEASDFGGQPIADGREVHLAPLPWVKRIVADKRPSRVVLDEYNLATQPTMAGAMRLLLERVSGDTKLPDDTRFMAIINPVATSVGGWELPGPISGRFIHLDVVADADDWVTGMLTGWAATSTRVTCLDPTEEDVSAAQAKVIAFIAANGDFLNQEPSDPVLAAGPWPSSRKWDWVSRILPYIPNEGDLLLRTVQGLVGAAAATAFFAWSEALDLPDVEDVLDPGFDIDWTAEPAERVQAILTSVVAVAGSSVERYVRVGAVLTAAVEAGHADVSLSVVKAYLTNAPDGAPRSSALLAAFAPLLARAGVIK